MPKCFFAARHLAIITLCSLAAGFASGQNAETVPLDSGWEFHQDGFGSVLEIWRGDKASDNVTWSPVTLLHCFNARDAVDPQAMALAWAMPGSSLQNNTNLASTIASGLDWINANV